MKVKSIVMPVEIMRSYIVSLHNSVHYWQKAFLEVLYFI